MEERGCKALCPNCGRQTDYVKKGRTAYRTVKGIDYAYKESYAVCRECKEEITAPGLDDENEERFECIYRKAQHLITVGEIRHLLDKYNIEKRPFSKLMGLGELTVTRYLEGQLPSRRYSDLLYEVLWKPEVMRRYLEEGKEQITGNAWRKAHAAVREQEMQMRAERKIEQVALYFIHICGEVTNLSLQEMLYYAKAVFFLKYGLELFPESGEAWVYGPVYPVIYHKYEKYHRNFLPDCDARVDYAALLDERERQVIEYIAGSMGVYGGWVLRELTRREQPWKNAREGLDDGAPSENTILEEDVHTYFAGVDSRYHITEKEGLTAYITSLGVI